MDPKFELVFHDDFSKENLDESKWSYDIGSKGWGNNENQYYTKENVYIENNTLIIEGKIEDKEDKNYTSSRINTFGKFSMRYGKVDVIAKIPKGNGTWPAIWMLPNSFKDREYRWPKCGEIDIMENIGRDHEVIHFSLHTGKYNHRDNTQITNFLSIPNSTSKFMKYSLVWTPDYIEFLIDDTQYFKVEKGSNNRDIDFDGWPFDQEFFLIINLALGGNWGGKIDDSILPVRFEIKDVKMYKLVL